MFLLPSESSKCLITVRKNPPFSPISLTKQALNPYPHHMCIYHWLQVFFNRGGCPGSQSPMTPTPLLIISNYFPGSLPKIIRSNPCMIIILSYSPYIPSGGYWYQKSVLASYIIMSISSNVLGVILWKQKSQSSILASMIFFLLLSLVQR